eukprot:1746651-Lingulodinium_polyedra.AAC.1
MLLAEAHGPSRARRARWYPGMLAAALEVIAGQANEAPRCPRVYAWIVPPKPYVSLKFDGAKRAWAGHPD